MEMKKMVYEGIPEEIRKGCRKGDQYGAFNDTAWWWFEKKTGDMHIFAADEGTTPDPAAPRYENSFRELDVRYLIIHAGAEGLTLDFERSPYIMPEFEEMLLPEGARTVPRIRGRIKRLKVPETVESLRFDNFFVSCGGHWDPVSYAVKQLILPSGIVFPGIRNEYAWGVLGICEPFLYWEEIVVYGDEKIQDLGLWYEANVFFKEFIIRYPKAWDAGKEGSYADEILAYIREQKPDRPCFGMAPAGREPYPEEELQGIRRRLLPY